MFLSNYVKNTNFWILSLFYQKSDILRVLCYIIQKKIGLNLKRDLLQDAEWICQVALHTIKTRKDQTSYGTPDATMTLGVLLQSEIETSDGRVNASLLHHSVTVSVLLHIETRKLCAPTRYYYWVSFIVWSCNLR